jgi:hypothetical protein
MKLDSGTRRRWGANGQEYYIHMSEYAVQRKCDSRGS